MGLPIHKVEELRRVRRDGTGENIGGKGADVQAHQRAELTFDLG